MRENGTDNEHRCLECGDIIPYGCRQDRKFCDDLCKNRWHNRQIVNSKAYRAKVNQKIDRNYRILKALLSAGIKSIGINEVKDMGFVAEYMTAHWIEGHRCYCMCYDIRYVILPSRIFRIEMINTSKSVIG